MSIRNIFLSILCTAALPLVSFAADAALSLSPGNGTYAVGNEFTMLITLHTNGAVVNAVEGKIKYLPDDLKVLSVDQADSPISSWTLLPEYTAEPGLISFGGVIPEGLVSDGKKLLAVRFLVLRSGETRVRISSGAAILAENGNGTNILTDLRGATYALKSSEAIPEAVHGGPAILRSSSHPDQNAWYASNDVFFEWSKTPDTTAIRFSVDQNPEGSPSLSDGVAEGGRRTLQDGVWYAHLSLRDDSGWSPIGHHRVQIDSERPDSLRVGEVPRMHPQAPAPTLEIEATDARSGISHFEISTDGGAPTRWEDDGNHRATLPPLSPGNHVVVVRAFDRAGNSLSETVTVSIDGLSLPRIDPTPARIQSGGEVDVRGEVGEGETVRIAIGFESGEPKIEEVASGPGGQFIHTFQFPERGVYRLRAQAIDKRGATSLWTEERTVEVEERSFLGAVGFADSGGTIISSMLFLIIGVFLGSWYMRWSGNMLQLRPEMAASALDGGHQQEARRGRVLGVFDWKKRASVKEVEEKAETEPARSHLVKASAIETRGYPERMHATALTWKSPDTKSFHPPTVLKGRG